MLKNMSTPLLISELYQAQILIIDDNAANVRLLERVLTEGGFVNLRSIPDGSLALASLKEFHPDLILLDLHMPKVDGFEVIRQIREEIGEESYLPILVLTADVTPGAKNKALAMGAKDFLAKPLDVVEVLLRVRNLLETRFLYAKLTESYEQCLQKSE
jgi:putative two-component system response regulator